MRELTIATGSSRYDRHWRNTAITWEDFCRRIENPAVMPVTAEQYKALSKASKLEKKDVGGYVGGYLTKGERGKNSVEYRDIITLDYDTFTPEQLEKALALGCACIVHSTAAHSAKAWRVRVIIPSSRSLEPDEYVAIARKTASRIGFAGIDRSTFEPSRLMFWPAHPQGGEWLCRRTDGEPLDADLTLASYHDWRNTAEWELLPDEAAALSYGVTDERGYTAGITGERGGRRPEDPTTKEGVIGAFCRTYDIHRAIEEFLSNEYKKAGRDRYTYTMGSSAGGARVLDEGKFLYSFHATDPAGMRAHNAFDLVRIHKFGHLDEALVRKEGDKLATTRFPSYKAMEDFCRQIPEVRRILIHEADSKSMSAFKGVDLSQWLGPEASADAGKTVETEVKIPEGKIPGIYNEHGDLNWEAIDLLPWDQIEEHLLMRDRKENIINNIVNAKVIVMEHPLLKGSVKMNDFSGNIEISGALPWKHKHFKARKGEVQKPENTWNNDDTSQLCEWMCRRYGFEGEKKILDGLTTAACERRYHPVLDYFESLTWDGEKRLHRIFVEILGAEDTPLNRELGELIFRGAAARIYNPGCKFDYFVIVYGPEGTYKSTLFNVMGGQWFSDSLKTFDGKEGMEAIQGVLIMEAGELVAAKRSEQTSIKSFISSRTDRYRPAYGHFTEVRPRQCIIVGTTNEQYCLRGIDTGNRRSPVVTIIPELSKVDFPPHWIEANRDQLWAEAVAQAKAGMPLYLNDDLTAAARAIESRHNLDKASPIFGEVLAYLDMWIPNAWESYTLEERQEYVRSSRSSADGGNNVIGEFHQRDTVTVAEILQECLKMKKTDRDYLSRARDVGQYLNTLAAEWVSVGNKRIPIYGVQKSWKRKKSRNLGNTLDDM